MWNITTRFHSFTDKNIPLFYDSEFVVNFFTNEIPDGKRPSAFLSLLIPNFIAKLFIIRQELLVFFGEMSHVLFISHR